ncbi:hypothetical protein [Lyngbya confervoides]|uniref:Uncharacterized protein n=1 Tax=Lyngbya confervoides BDU141951 TaxID=1574623 RepID=A0ABD4SZ59_9CYAN|nr:hypothetical protein [Lyngbya confervoides]MCM1981607.1 hypothetical protein [Lyngbya confervoides BDU141951]
MNDSSQSSLRLSDSSVWMVDGSILEGQTQSSEDPLFTVPNLITDPNQQVVVPVDNTAYEEPAITFSTLAALGDETFDTSTPENTAVETAVYTGNVQLASDPSASTLEINGSSVNGTTVETAFGSSSGDGSGSGGESLTSLPSGEGGGDQTPTGEAATLGESASGDLGTPTADSTPVPFSFTQTLGLAVLLVCLVGHKAIKRFSHRLGWMN